MRDEDETEGGDRGLPPVTEPRRKWFAADPGSRAVSGHDIGLLHVKDISGEGCLRPEDRTVQWQSVGLGQATAKGS